MNKIKLRRFQKWRPLKRFSLIYGPKTVNYLKCNNLNLFDTQANRRVKKKKQQNISR